MATNVLKLNTDLSSVNSAGLPSGFITLPRVSRLDRPFQDGDVWRGSLPENYGHTRTRSDSLASFKVDLGPSLVTEVLNLIDNPAGLQMYSSSPSVEDEEVEEFEEGGRDDCDSLLTDTPVQSPQVTSPSSSVGGGSFTRSSDSRRRSRNSAQSERFDDGCSPQTPAPTTGSPQTFQAAMEPERFKRAAEVLCRHYGGGSFTKEGRRTSPPSHHYTEQYSFPEDEEEIKI